MLTPDTPARRSSAFRRAGFYAARFSEMNNWKMIGFAGLMAVVATALLAFKVFGT
jgi:hypothetical protein